MPKQPLHIRLANDERRALRMLAGARGVSMQQWTSETIAQEWEKNFPGMSYPDKEGRVRPKENTKGSKNHE